jgi:RNA polymerase sigma-70 factor (ECF subfamily)
LLAKISEINEPPLPDQSAPVANLDGRLFMTIARSFERYQPLTRSASFRKWMGTITTNKLRDYWRKHQTLPLATGGTTWHKLLQSIEDNLVDGSISTVNTACEPDGLWKEIVHALRAEVSLRDWRIFERVVLEEKAPADTAKEFKVTNNVVYLVQSRILRRIRDLLDTDTSLVPLMLRME